MKATRYLNQIYLPAFIASSFEFRDAVNQNNPGHVRTAFEGPNPWGNGAYTNGRNGSQPWDSIHNPTAPAVELNPDSKFVY